MTPTRSCAPARAALLAIVAAGALAAAVLPPALGKTLRHGRIHSVAAAASDAPASLGTVSAQPMLGVPASQFEVIGASPGESPGEAWAEGTVGAVPATVGGQTISNSQVLLRYTGAAGTWQIVPVDDSSGAQLGLQWVASEVTAGGGVVLAGTAGSSETIVTRDPGGPFAQATPPAADTLLSGETLYPDSGIPTMASLDESGHVGVLIAPGSERRTRPGVLHYLNGTWTREAVCLRYTSAVCIGTGQLTPVAISASSPGNAWMLGTTPKGTILFQREAQPGGAQVWIAQHPATWLLGAGPPPINNEIVSSPQGPVLTATGQGVWVDRQLASGQQTGTGTVFVAPSAPGELAGTWCYPTSLCPIGTASLGAALPSNYGSFTWPGSSPTDPGTRIISGLPTAALLRFSAGSFAYEITGGDNPSALGGGGTFGPGGETLTTGNGQQGGAAFSSPDEGFLGTALTPPEDAPKVVQLTTSPAAGVLTTWPVPFRGPLLALAASPGSTPGDGNAQALAVGIGGEIARYTPGKGWVAEFLYDSAGVRQTPNLRGVAWPESGRAYAVGDNGAMWLWRRDTGLWEPDPAKPFNFHGSLNAVAFRPGSSTDGYAVGKQGVLLAYSKTWTQEPIPPQLAQAHFTSIAFAGGEAIASYRTLAAGNAGKEEGGLLVNDGSGWQIDASAQALLATLPASQTVITKVAGLPDGGAVAAGPGVVLERDSSSSPWRFSMSPLPDSANGNIAALAAIREGGSVRALASIDDDPGSSPSGINNLLWQNVDNPPAASAGQPPILIGPDPLPSQGFLVRETAGGWVDLEHNDHPNLLAAGTSNFDLPGWPDSVLALLVDPASGQGWAVGGETGGDTLQVDGASGAASVVNTAGVMRLGGGPAPPVSNGVPIPIPSGQATFAIGGGSGCAQACAGNAGQRLGPDAWLAGAISRASQIGGLRSFVYLGQRVAARASLLGVDTFNRELIDYANVLGTGGALPVYAAASATDVDPAAGGASDFASILGSHAPAGSSPPGTPAPPPGTAAYAFDSAGAGGTVRMIVLDYSAGSLSAGGGAQLQWLASQLDSAQQAGIPAVVAGSGDITDARAPNSASDAATVQQTLLTHGASAYVFYDASEQNVSQTIGSGSDKIPVYGTGTLGYVLPPSNAEAAQAFLGASGFLLLSVDTAQRNSATNRAPVSVTLVPNAGDVALDATDGTFLRRSQVALFQGLARRPLGGNEWVGGSAGSQAQAPDPYTVLPETCIGGACAQFIKPDYTFSSSKPQIGNFVEHDPNSTDPRQVLQDAKGKPVPDPTSGLFCSFNAGTTTVTVTTGGLSYSEAVTVQPGSVLEPCGTVPLTPGSTTTTQTPPPPPPPPPPPGPGPPAGTVSPPVQVPPPPAAVTPANPVAAPPSVPAPPVSPPLVLPFVAIAPSPPKVLLPVSSITARPIPPSGFGTVPVAVPVPVRVVEEKKEEEEAVESARNSFATYRADDHSGTLTPVAVLVLLLAAGAGSGMLRRRRPRGGAAYARSEIRRERRR